MPADFITSATLAAAGMGPTQARQFAAPLRAACERFRLDTPARAAALLGQCMHESSRFTALEEGLFYRDPARIARLFKSRVPSIQAAQRLAKAPRALANVVYANRLGNGAEATGDGWAYRGSGAIQLTGRGNYRAAGAGIGMDLEGNPALVRADPAVACLTAAWFLASKGCIPLADAGQIDAITRTVNPAMLGDTERREYTRAAAEAFAWADA